MEGELSIELILIEITELKDLNVECDFQIRNNIYPLGPHSVQSVGAA